MSTDSNVPILTTATSDGIAVIGIFPVSAAEISATALSSRRTTATTASRGHAAPHRSGDIAPTESPAAIESFVVGTSLDSGIAGAAVEHARHSVWARCQRSRFRFTKLLVRRMRVEGSVKSPNPDDELSTDWRDGGYPYKNLMQRPRTTSGKVSAPSRASEAASLGKGNQAKRS